MVAYCNNKLLFFLLVTIRKLNWYCCVGADRRDGDQACE
jgi:hypothetical protein